MGGGNSMTGMAFAIPLFSWLRNAIPLLQTASPAHFLNLTKVDKNIERMERQQTLIHAFFSSGSITQSEQAATGSVTGLTEGKFHVDLHDGSDLPLDSDPDSCESENESEHTPLLTTSEGCPEDSRELLLQPNQSRLKSIPPPPPPSRNSVRKR